MIQLVMHNMICRQRLLTASRLQVRGEHKAKAIANGLNYSDLHNTIQSRRAGNRFGGTNISRQFLDSVDACTKALPHTNEAAKYARGVGECMQHHFGTGSIFLTVTFDDEHCIITQVLSGENIDGNENLDDLSEDELKQRSKRRKELRLKYPGACALNFEMLLQILCEEIIGWDWRNKRATENPGYYGYCDALSAAIEEQGRKSLHVHMTLWIRGYSSLREEMCFGRTARNKLDAENALKKYYDHVATTELVKAPQRDIMKLLRHDCCCEIEERVEPRVVEDQKLRYLRHRLGHKASGSEFARCIHCVKKWTSDELVACFVTNSAGMSEVTTTTASGNVVQELPKHRMHAAIVEYQKIPKSPVTKKMSRIINATYQTHSCNHHSSCFKCQKGSGPKRKHVCGPLCECRYRLPDRKRARTEIKTEVGDASWYLWDGSERSQPLVQLLPKRGKYDLYQNISCPAVSETKMACNSNIALITEGPIGQYQFKYHLKQTQDDDTAEYAQVDATIKKVTGRLHENERSEAVRLITRGAFAHNKTNVINAPLASFLLRNSSRFYFSHDFQYCPVRDLIKIHQNKGVSSVMRFCCEGGNYFENQALNYLCRPRIAEYCSVKKFVEQFEVRFATKRTMEDGVVPFIADTGFFKHPSRLESIQDGECRQGIMERMEPVRAKVTQWQFPDTATFNGNILECEESEINGAMEGYAEFVLTLLLPHRHGRELKMDDDKRFPYARKFREVWNTEQLDKQYGREIQVFTEENTMFLQNVQNARSNSLRYKVKNDDLAGVTVPYDPDEDNLLRDLDENPDLDEFEQALEDAIPYEAFMDQLQFETEVDPHDNMPELLPRTLEGFKFDSIRNEGTKGCGYMCEAASMAPEVDPSRTEPFLREANPQSSNTNSNSNSNFDKNEKRIYSIRALVEILLRRTEKKLHKDVFDGKDIEVPDANGTVWSIREWGKDAFGTDRKQRRAFEAIAAAFVLTFLEDTSDSEEDTTAGDLSKLRRTKLALLRLKGHRDNPQLICLLHGPGGSGKSTVINMVMAYAKSFCEVLGHPFTSRTIIITAMSGVAATLLHGETTHSVIGLNRTNVQEEEIEAFADARLLIIDEISFASKRDFQKLYSRCQKLMRQNYKVYGGLNVVFAGDYSQLEPVRQSPIYVEGILPEFHAAINCFIELDGKWRFMKDPPWGEAMFRFREGNPTIQDIDLINENCHVDKKPPPAGIPIATHTNANRDAVNAAVFEEYCIKNKPQDGSVLNSAVMIFMDNLCMRNSGKALVAVESNCVKKFFYENYSESKCDVGDRGRIDPVLRTFADCPMMLTQNKNVPEGQANGSRVTLHQIVVRTGEQPFPLKLACGTTVNGLFASQVKTIIVKHVAPDIIPQFFEVQAEDFTFTSTLQIGTENVVAAMKGTQFPVISNACTTGHKLQGCTCHDLLVNEWHYGSNWAYVVLSRVKTMAGLFIRQKLSYDLKKYRKPERMTKMLQYFREKCSISDITDEEYDELVTSSDINH